MLPPLGYNHSVSCWYLEAHLITALLAKIREFLSSHILGYLPIVIRIERLTVIGLVKMF